MNSRRKFLKQIGMVSGALFIADSILADPYKPLLINPLSKNYIRVKGSVTQNSKPVKDVVVSDGVSVTATTSDGTYELITDSNQEFIFISIPAGYKIPVSNIGTAYFYKRITHNTSNEQVIDFNLEKSIDDNEHKFLLFADPQTLDMDDITRFNNETINDVNKFYPGKENLFVVSCGDIMFDHLELFPEYEKAIAKTGLPYFQVLGNHDVDGLSRTDEKSHLTFQNFFGPRYYSFNKGEVHYVVMDNIFWYGDYIGYFDQPQLDWLQKDLEYIEKGKIVIVFCHIPPNNFSSERNDSSDKASVTVVNRELLYSILKGYKSYIITGHMHESEFISEQGVQIHVCGAVCGAWWSDNICYDGTPNGYMQYSVKGSELSWIYKSTGKDFKYQMKSYLNKNENNKNDLSLNIWGATNDQKIFWYEDGIRKGTLERFTGFDPATIELFRGSDKPKKHSWVDPSKTDHLFKLSNLETGKEITIEYTDLFRNIFTEKIIG